MSGFEKTGDTVEGAYAHYAVESATTGVVTWTLLAGKTTQRIDMAGRLSAIVAAKGDGGAATVVVRQIVSPGSTDSIQIASEDVADGVLTAVFDGTVRGGELEIEVTAGQANIEVFTKA